MGMEHPHQKERLPEYMEGILAGLYSRAQVARWTGYTREHISRLSKRYREEGPACLVNGHKGKPGPRAIPQATKDKIVAIYKKDFIHNGDGTQFSCFRDELELHYGISYSYRAVYDMLTAAGIDSPEKRRVKRKRAHRPRPRRKSEGELIQIDASRHQWFARLGDEGYYTLHGAVDDATGKITALCLAEAECSYGYYSVLEQTIRNGGLPDTLYSDRAAMLCSGEGQTQFQRVLAELEIAQAFAPTCQAKGRIERLWRTLQGRIPVMLKVRGISTIKEANRFLREEFIPFYNAKFAEEAAKPPVWRKPREGWRRLLCNRIPRKTNSAGVLSYLGYKLQVDAYPDLVRRNVELCVYRNGLRALYKGRYYPVYLAEAPPRTTAGKVLREIIARTLKKNGRMGGG